MHRLVQERFREAPDDPDDPLALHAHGEASPAVAVFVHGLGGSRYGRGATWGRVPPMVFDRNPGLDVGLYGYRSLLGRIRFWRSIPIERQARLFAECLRDQLPHASIILVGHSLGGLVCKGAIEYLLNTGQASVLARIRGLFLMATPQAGSLRVPGFGSWLSKDFRVLRAHSEYSRRVNRAFVDRLVIDEESSAVGLPRLPTFAVSAASDRWVDLLSSELNVPSAQSMLAEGSHTSIVKAPSPDDAVFGFLEGHVRRLLAEAEEGAEELVPEHLEALLDEPPPHEEPPSPFDLPDGPPETLRVEAAVERREEGTELVLDVSYFPVFLTTADATQEPIQCGCKVASTTAEMVNGKATTEPDVASALRGGRIVLEQALGRRPRFRAQAEAGEVLDGSVRLRFPVEWSSGGQARIRAEAIAFGVRDRLSGSLGRAADLILSRYLRGLSRAPVIEHVELEAEA